MKILCFVSNLQGLEIADWESDECVLSAWCHLDASARTHDWLSKLVNAQLLKV